ncbi:hypothetical protein jhhlp_000726 [Lomentospora prolificans]|uniref:Uncharacterized protein n=1 Tax=Lomentospora prolificans TaxID=41688 RepID=A0A2N3NJ90_9PEZI|nr:hypothetical protein jhhlp_000726 [Lomentospora prolificans]
MGKSMEGVNNASTQWFLRAILFPLPSLPLHGETEPPTRKSYNRNIEWLKEVVPEDRSIGVFAGQEWLGDFFVRRLAYPCRRMFRIQTLTTGKPLTSSLEGI